MDVIFVSEAMFMIVLKIGSRKINSIFSETWAAYEIKRKNSNLILREVSTRNKVVYEK